MRMFFICLAAAIVLLGLAALPVFCQSKLPKILNPGDTAIATVPVWIQTLDSEIDQRLETKAYKDKLATFVKQTGEIDRLQSGLEALQNERSRLIQRANEKNRMALENMSALVDSCARELDDAISSSKALQKDRDRLKNGRNFWRGAAVGQAIILIAGVLLIAL